MDIWTALHPFLEAFGLSTIEFTAICDCSHRYVFMQHYHALEISAINLYDDGGSRPAPRLSEIIINCLENIMPKWHELASWEGQSGRVCPMCNKVHVEYGKDANRTISTRKIISLGHQFFVQFVNLHSSCY